MIHDSKDTLKNVLLSRTSFSPNFNLKMPNLFFEVSLEIIFCPFFFRTEFLHLEVNTPQLRQNGAFFDNLALTVPSPS